MKSVLFFPVFFAFAAEAVGVTDIGQQGSESEFRTHDVCKNRLRIGKRDGDGSIVYWCPYCRKISQVVDGPVIR